MTTSTTDCIRKEIHLRAPRTRVWKALSDAEEFGTWFGMKLEGRFAPGQPVFGRITHPDYSHIHLEMRIERMEAERLFSYRWHPYPMDMKRDYSIEPMTLVEFHLEAAEGGTLLKVVESGFDQLPPDRRDEAFRMNDGGWTSQLVRIERHVTS
ncbi:SRPBCC family protein [Geothrix mesophila]|uniref:SRPBCC family protein n=1 Tax=Geothrix mesophila TaxID=2922723 RepID=UPI001FAD8480|nr:SRPBCC family protein [Geothrix sp. SG198]